MIITQEFDVRATRQALWDFLTDVERVAACMPGVEKVEQVDERTYRAQMGVRIGPIKASFSGDVVFIETHPPERMRIRATWKEHYTSSKADVLGEVELQELADGRVRCGVTVEASVLGALGKYGQGVAQKKAAEINESFAACVRAVLEQEAAPEALRPRPAGAPAIVGRSFEYFRPATLDEVFELLRSYGDEAKVMAGGQALVLLLREGLVKPGVLIDLTRIDGLDQIQQAAGNSHLEVGALATHRQVELSPLFQQHFPFIPEAYRNLGSVPIRNVATLGGNLCHNAPGSDPPPLLIGLDATVRLQSLTGERSLSVEEFGTDFYETALQTGELLIQVSLPFLPPATGIAYAKLAARPMDMAIVGVVARITLDSEGEKCRDARLVLSGVAPTTRRARQAEAMLEGQGLREALVAEVAEMTAGEIDPISDIHASADYRRQLTPVAVRRMMMLAWQRAREDWRRGREE